MANAKYDEAIIKIKLDTSQARQQLAQAQQGQLEGGGTSDAAVESVGGGPGTTPTAKAGKRGTMRSLERHAGGDHATGASPLQTLARAAANFTGLRTAQNFSTMLRNIVDSPALRVMIVALVAKLVAEQVKSIPEKISFAAGLTGTKLEGLKEFATYFAEWTNKIETMWGAFNKAKDQTFDVAGYIKRLGGTIDPSGGKAIGDVGGFLFDKAAAESRVDFKVKMQQAMGVGEATGEALRNLFKNNFGR